MSQQRIGQVLQTMVSISDHDVEEILQEQHMTRQKFGEIALAWGLCQPSDVWHAWHTQLGGETPMVDLNVMGIDAQAVACVPMEIAVQNNMMPLRLDEDRLVVAIPLNAGLPDGDLVRRLAKDVRFVRADAEQILAAIRAHYFAELARV